MLFSEGIAEENQFSCIKGRACFYSYAVSVEEKYIESTKDFSFLPKYTLKCLVQSNIRES